MEKRKGTESKEFGEVFGAIIERQESVQDMETDYAKIKPKKIVELI